MVFSEVHVSNIEDCEFLAGRHMDSFRSHLSSHLVDELDVSERSSSHDFVVASSRAIGVIIFLLDTSFAEVTCCRRVFGDTSCRRDMVGGDEIAEIGKAVGILDWFNGFGCEFSGLEEWWVVDVGRVFPLVDQRLLDFQVIPSLGAFGDIAVHFPEHLRLECFLDEFVCLFASGPNIFQVDFLASLISAERLGLEIEIHSAGKRVGNNERRRSQVGSLNHLVHSGLEVTVPGKHSRSSKILILDSLLDFRVKCAGVADTHHASIPSSRESQLIEVTLYTGLVEVLRHNPRTRSQDCLDVGFHRQPALDSILRKQPGCNH